MFLETAFSTFKSQEMLKNLIAYFPCGYQFSPYLTRFSIRITSPSRFLHIDFYIRDRECSF